MLFYIGSFTKTGGVGVGLCSLQDGEMKIVTSHPLPNAIYVILNRERSRLYAICSDPVKESIGGSVAAYDVSGGQLKLLSRCDTIGDGPCHLCLDEQERHLYAANYFTGSVSVFALEKDGGIKELIQHVCHTGKSVHPIRQTGPYAHQVTFIPDTDLLCAVDLGLDQLIVYRQDAQTGQRTEYSVSHVPAGFGPRHLLYGADGLAYLVGEVSNQVSVLRWDGFQFHVLQTLTTLPDDFAGENTASAIRRQGDRVYVSNRGHNSIAVYDVKPNGWLSLHAVWPTSDDFPRDFDFIDADTLLIGHQNGALTLEEITDCGLRCVSRLDMKGCVCILPVK